MAITKFATSSLALPYLIPVLNTQGISWRFFMTFVACLKPSINGLKSFLKTLIPKSDDPEEIKICRKILQYISQVFVQFFSANWIFSRAQLKHKLAYLNYRFKIFRRINNPSC
jgi:hypothetical protein